MKALIQKTVCAAGSLFAILTALYLGLSLYYADGFSYGTWVNSVYCTGKTVSEINMELAEADTYESIMLILPDGRRESICMEDISYQADFTKALIEIQNTQNSWKWYENLSKEAQHRKVMPDVRIDEEQLKKKLSSMNFLKNRKPDDAYRIFIRKTKQGYELMNERAQAPDFFACQEAVKEAILGRKKELDLLQAGCYKALPTTSAMQEILNLWERLDAFQNSGVSYQFGEELHCVDASAASTWLLTREGADVLSRITSPDIFLTADDGRFLVDRERIEAYVDSLADVYDTVGTKRQFQTTEGRIIEVSGGTYGNLLDRNAEKEYLCEIFEKQEFFKQKPQPHQPKYLQSAKKQGKNDIGDTYIEIDMGNQMLYYYEDGRKMLETPIVTGDMKRKRSTPEMVCYVYAKQKNRTLRGPGYASFVKYWMPVKGGIGIHDARWRKEFGGEIYQTQGSHGCINLPSEQAEKLYEQVNIGTPVVMFYGNVS